MKSIDLTKTPKGLYAARRAPQAIQSRPGTFLAVDGCGPPGGPQFQSALQSLFAVVYTAKFAGKLARTLDFKVGYVEGLYYSKPPTPIERWKWRLLIRIPDPVTAGDLARARRMIRQRNGPDVSRVRRIRWNEGKALQMLHVGPYGEVGLAYRQLQEFARARGFSLAGPAHEIYISDPRRTALQKLRTIVRLRMTARPRGRISISRCCLSGT